LPLGTLFALSLSLSLSLYTHRHLIFSLIIFRKTPAMPVDYYSVIDNHLADRSFVVFFRCRIYYFLIQFPLIPVVLLSGCPYPV
jgi:hypothetical protein